MAVTKIIIPPAFASDLPTLASLAALKQMTRATVPASSPLHRAAWTKDSVLPLTAKNRYRFGPPPALVAGKTSRPYWWLYVADAIETCIYETGFCEHDKTRPGHFYINRTAQKGGQIASLLFPTELRLLDLTGQTAYHMGIYDRVSSPNHEWCQWFACHLVNEGFFTGAGRFDGILYPSRKNRGKNAIALYSGYVNRKVVRSNIHVTLTLFKKTADYKALTLSPHIIPAP
jgi:RES domain-containing protein